MFGWFKKKAGSVKDYGAEISNAKEIKGTFDNIKDMANKNLNPYNIKKGRVETFEEAVKRNGVSEIEIAAIYKNMVLSFYVSLMFALICIGTAFYAVFVTKSLMGMFSGIGICLFCLANCFRFSLRAYQIRHRKLCSASEWWNNSSEWLPPFNTKKG